MKIKLYSSWDNYAATPNTTLLNIGILTHASTDENAEPKYILAQLNLIYHSLKRNKVINDSVDRLISDLIRLGDYPSTGWMGWPTRCVDSPAADLRTLKISTVHVRCVFRRFAMHLQ
jgi:hypothetical protein